MSNISASPNIENIAWLPCWIVASLQANHIPVVVTVAVQLRFIHFVIKVLHLPCRIWKRGVKHVGESGKGGRGEEGGEGGEG